MANDIVIPKNFGAISSVFTPDMLDETDEFAAGITGGFGILGFRGKVWRTKFRGEEETHLNEDGTPKGYVDVVLVKSNAHLSKVYYANGYIEGSTEPPDCASSNGVVPDGGVPAPQCETCAGCAHNQWGSRITESGKKGKACSDSKRAVVVPLDDLANEVYGGPMLLRVPAATLNDLASYANKMKGLGYPLFLIGTRIRFEIDAAYPKLVFSPLRPLNDEEAAFVRSLRDDYRVGHILASSEEQERQLPSQVFEQPEAAPKPVAQAPKPVAQAPKPVATKPVAQAPKPAVQTPKPGIAAAVANPQRPAVQPAPKTAHKPAPVQQAEPVEEEYVEQGEEAEVPAGFADELEAQLEALL